MNALARLERWYHTQCNGEWEHTYGVKVDTLDNPGWSVAINLHGTALAARPFPEHRYGVEKDGEPSGEDWVECKVEGETFIGFGGPFKLQEVLEVFLDWAERKS
jgi:hypothetical protein